MIFLKNIQNCAFMFYSVSLLNFEATSLSHESATASIIVAIYQNMINNNMWYVFLSLFFAYISGPMIHYRTVTND